MTSPSKQKPLVVFKGRGKIMIASSGDYKDPDALMADIAQISEPMDVVVEGFNINLMQSWSVNVVLKVIKILFFIENLMIPRRYEVGIEDGELVIQRKPYEEEEK